MKSGNLGGWKCCCMSSVILKDSLISSKILSLISMSATFKNHLKVDSEGAQEGSGASPRILRSLAISTGGSEEAGA